MDNNNRIRQEKDPLELSKEAYGFGEDQLAEEFERAKEQLLQQPLQQEDVQDRFKKLVSAIEERGIRPEYLEVEKKRKTVNIRRIWKPLLVAAVVGTLLVGTGITVMGKRYYVYQSRDVQRGKEIRVRNDGKGVYQGEDSVAVYAAIEQDLGIDALMLTNLPGEFEIDTLEIINEHARLSIKIDGKYVNFVQMKYDKEMVGMYDSDCKEFTEVENEWLGITIPIRKNVLENNEVEYRADFSLGDSYYFLTAKIDENSFKEIVDGIAYYKER